MEEIVFLLLFVVGGWILGIVGFFRAGRALREVRELRRASGGTPVPSADQGAPAPAYGAPFVGFPAATPPAGDPAGNAALARTAPVPDIAPARTDTDQPAPEPPATTEGTADDIAPPLIPPPVSPPVGPPVSPPGVPPAKARPRRDLESVLTLQLGLWLGAAALLMAGVFLIRYAVDEGYFGPAARCVAAAMLGVALLGAAEWLRRRPPPVLRHQADAASPDAATSAPLDPDDPWAVDRSPAALAAGGVAILFGAAYGAGPFYDLVPALFAFVLLAGAGMAGLLASLRFGQLVGAVGVTGAFVTPLLVQTDAPSLPGLFGYLLVVTAASLGVVRYTAWTWLGWATTLACALWVMVAAALATGADVWAPSLFVPAAAALNLALLPRAALDQVVGRRLSWIPFAALGCAGLLLETAFSAPSPRIGVLLLVPLSVAKGMFEPRLDRLPWLASLLFLLTLLLWALPDWQPTGEVISIEGVVQAVLPGAWAPAVIQPLLLTAAGVAGFLALAGLYLERRAPNPLRWAALVGAVPVLTLAVTYAQVDRFQPDVIWSFAALALTAALVFTTFLAQRGGGIRHAGVHAAGAVASLTLACAMLLHDHWLTLAIALFLPPLAWIEARADLPALRKVALAVAALVLVRLLLNWYVLDYAFGTTPILNGLLAAYGIPAVAFGLAAIMFRGRGDDLTVAVLESGAVVFASVLVALEIRHWETHADFRSTGSLDEFAFHVATLALQAFVNLGLARRTGRPVLGWAWRIQGALALTGSAILLLDNPMFEETPADTITLLVGYLLPVLLATAALRMLPPGPLANLLGGYAVIGGLGWVMLEVRDRFHPGAMAFAVSPVTDAELWAWSGAGLVYGAALMALGIGNGGRALRMAALAIIGLMSAKVFLIDMAGLAGLWRVVSFLGLGLMLITLGAVYRRFVLPREEEAG